MDDDAAIAKAPGPEIENSPPTHKHYQSPRSDEVRINPDALFSDIYNYPWEQDSEFQSGLSAILQNTGQTPLEGKTHQDIDLLLQAQCFYFSRKYNLPTAIDVAAYKLWLNEQAKAKPAAVSSQEVIGHFESLDDSPHNHFSPVDQPPPLRQNQANASPASPSITTTSFSSPHTQVSTPSNHLPNPSHQSLPPGAPSPTQQPSNPQAPGPPYPTTFASIVDLITRNQPIPGIEQIPNTVLDASLSPQNKTPRRRKPWEKDTVDVGDATADTTSAPSDDNAVEHHHDDDGKEEENDGHGGRLRAAEQSNGTHALSDQQ